MQQLSDTALDSRTSIGLSLVDTVETESISHQQSQHWAAALGSDPSLVILVISIHVSELVFIHLLGNEVGYFALFGSPVQWHEQTYANTTLQQV